MSTKDTQSSLDAETRSPTESSLEQKAYELSQARRRLLGAAILLLLACSLIPWILDIGPRAWGDDVILTMPKHELPYQQKPNDKPNANPALLNPAKPNATGSRP